MLCKDTKKRLSIKNVLNYKMFDRYRIQNKNIKKVIHVEHVENQAENTNLQEPVLHVNNEGPINEIQELKIKKNDAKIERGMFINL